MHLPCAQDAAYLAGAVVRSCDEAVARLVEGAVRQRQDVRTQHLRDSERIEELAVQEHWIRGEGMTSTTNRTHGVPPPTVRRWGRNTWGCYTQPQQPCDLSSFTSPWRHCKPPFTMR